MGKIDEQIIETEKELRKIPHHKATDHYIGRLRAKLSKLYERLETSGKKSGGGGYAVKKQGDATVVLVGPPSVGKSTLLNALTNAKSKTAEYPFTTVAVVPGMLEYKNAYIQLLDVPGLIEKAEEGKGRGREVLSVVRTADLVLIVVDVKTTTSIDKIKNILKNAYIETKRIIVVNKIDTIKPSSSNAFNEACMISASTKKGLDEIKLKIWKELGLVRVYVNDGPIIMHEGQSLGEVLAELGSEKKEEYKLAKIWGPGSKFPGQIVNLEKKIVEEMRIKFV